MAYTTTITENGINTNGDGTYSINFHVVINNSIEDIFSTDISIIYDPQNPNIEVIKSNMINELRSRWDTFIQAANISNSPALDTAISEMETTADNYINS